MRRAHALGGAWVVCPAHRANPDKGKGFVVLQRGDKRIDANGVRWDVASVQTRVDGVEVAKVLGPNGRSATEDTAFIEDVTTAAVTAS